MLNVMKPLLAGSSDGDNLRVRSSRRELKGTVGLGLETGYGGTRGTGTWSPWREDFGEEKGFV